MQIDVWIDLSTLCSVRTASKKYQAWPIIADTVYPKKYAHGFCFAVLCCGYILTDFPISIRLTSLTLWQSNDCPSASKTTLMNMDKYFMWIHYERLHNPNKAKHNKTVCIFLGIYCIVCWWNIQYYLTYLTYNSDVTWASWYPNHPKPKLYCLSNRLFRLTLKKTSNICISGSLWGIHRWPMDSLHKGPVIRKLISCHDVIMKYPCLSSWYMLCCSIMVMALANVYKDVAIKIIS